MPRYEGRIDRSSFSLFKKLKSSSAEDQVEEATAAIDILRGEADRHFVQGSNPFKRWHKGCDELSESVDEFLAKSRVFSVEAIVILEEFINVFEHHETRFRQMLDSATISEADRHQIVEDTWNLLSVILRFAIYALVLEYRNDPSRRQPVSHEHQEGTNG